MRDYGLGPEPADDDAAEDTAVDVDAEFRTSLEEVADIIADRLELAIVQRVPQGLIDLLQDGAQGNTQLLGVAYPNYVQMYHRRNGNILEIGFESNGQRVASFRFAGAPSE